MMARPRKRKRPASVHDEALTHDLPFKKKDNSRLSVNSRAQHPVLSQYYPQVQNLRDYIITQLPSSSRIRRRKVSAVGIISKSPGMPLSDMERALGALLDTTLVGLSKPMTEEDHRMDGWKDFSQRGDESYVTLSNGVAGFIESQALVSEWLSHYFLTDGPVVEIDLAS
ncbi:hypothetical protein F4782DRAFT_483632 [Xylaria castorea]|nr:hypothetical protein F4782DRAFT_483632 [Xylaria castorea]